MNTDPNQKPAGDGSLASTKPVMGCYDMANDPGTVLVTGGDELPDLGQPEKS